MKGVSIVLDEISGREAAALLRDGRLEDLLIDSDTPRPGTIYRAKAGRPMKGQGGIILDTPDGPAFLRQTRGISPGEMLIVQVTGHAEPGKALPVTPRLLLKSRYAIVTPGAPGINISRGLRDDDRRDALQGIAAEVLVGHPMLQTDPPAGLILRSSCETGADDDIAADIAAMADLAAAIAADTAGPPEKLLDGDGPHTIAWRDWSARAPEEGGFATHGVDEMIAALRTPRVDLSGGQSLFIEPTRALVAIDVNTGADTSPAAGLKANLAAAREIPRQLRLRGLGGQIVVDVAPMPKKDRRTFESALRAGFRTDDTETALAGWTPLGLYELQRKRARLPLADLLAGPLADPAAAPTKGSR